MIDGNGAPDDSHESENMNGEQQDEIQKDADKTKKREKRLELRGKLKQDRGKRK